MERPQIQRKKCVDGNKAEWPSGLRSQTQEIHQSRILVHECARGFESHSCQKTFWTRWGRAFSRQILSNWNVNWRWQSKAKNKKILTSSVTDSRAVYKYRNRKITSRDMWKTKVRVGLNTNLFKWMTQTIWQITSNGWHKPFGRLRLWIEKKLPIGKATNRKKKNVSTETRQSGRAV